MHVVIINGSPRIEKNSNTDKIIEAFGKGLTSEGVSYEKYAVSKKESWNDIRDAYINNTEILIALPLYVECIPGILLEFLETLPVKDESTKISFILQSGFAEASQLRCGEEFLKNLPTYLGVTYGGTLIKGDCFGIRLVDEAGRDKMTNPFINMGKLFAKDGNFFGDAAKRFAGPEYFPLPIRVLLQIMFKTMAKKKFEAVAKEWGCTVPLDDKPFA